MTANDSKVYLGYLNKLADQYQKAYHRSIDKRAIDPYYSALNEEIETSPLSSKLKLEWQILDYGTTRIFLAKRTPKIDQEKCCLLILCLKLINI